MVAQEIEAAPHILREVLKGLGTTIIMSATVRILAVSRSTMKSGRTIQDAPINILMKTLTESLQQHLPCAMMIRKNTPTNDIELGADHHTVLYVVILAVGMHSPAIMMDMQTGRSRLGIAYMDLKSSEEDTWEMSQ